MIIWPVHDWFIRGHGMCYPDLLRGGVCSRSLATNEKTIASLYVKQNIEFLTCNSR